MIARFNNLKKYKTMENSKNNTQSSQSCVSDSFSDDDFIDWWIENEPDLTEEEQKQKMIDLDKCCDFILKQTIQK